MGQQTLDLLGRCEWKKLNTHKFPPNGGEQMEMNPMVEPIRKDSPTKELLSVSPFLRGRFPTPKLPPKKETKKNDFETEKSLSSSNYF